MERALGFNPFRRDEPPAEPPGEEEKTPVPPAPAAAVDEVKEMRLAAMGALWSDDSMNMRRAGMAQAPAFDARDLRKSSTRVPRDSRDYHWDAPTELGQIG